MVHHYRIEKCLGGGGFGVTYMVTDVNDGHICALKELFPEKMAFRDIGDVVKPKEGYESSFKQFRQMVLDEAQTIYNFRGNPNIIEVGKRFNWNGTVYYSMEYLDGEDLKGVLRRNGGRLPWEQLRPIMEQVVRGLSVVHSRGVIHCDISPDNIFILRNGTVKIIDFGAARGAVQEDNKTTFLKVGFAPPEQMTRRPPSGTTTATQLGSRIGPWTDIYALAVSIYRAYTGQMPPVSMERQNGDRTIWPSQMGMRLPSDNWEYALRRAMALRPEDRYHNILEFWRDLAGGLMNSTLVLEGVQGDFRGQRIPVEQMLVFGRERAHCSILYPLQTPGVSGQHLRVWSENGSLFAMDLNSTYGTWLGNNKMRPFLCYALRPDDTLFFGANQMFKVVRQDDGMTHRM